MHNIKPAYLQPVYILISDLNYNSDIDQVREITRRQFYRIKRFDGRYLRQRISLTRYKQLAGEIERQEAKEYYSKAIQKKYNVGPNWAQNRYFVEQVRPTIYQN